MKKILLIVLFLFSISSIVNSQTKLYFMDTLNGRSVLREVSSTRPLPVRLIGGLSNVLDTNRLAYLDKYNLFSKVNHFTRMTIFDTVVLNKLDSVKSTYWYYPNGSLFGFIDPTRDSASLVKLYVGALGTYTIVNGNSITTNTLNSDSIVGNSPINLVADSVIAKNKIFATSFIMNGTPLSDWFLKKQDTSSYYAKLNTNQTFTSNLGIGTANNFISKLAIGMADSTGAFNIVRSDKNLNRTTLIQATDTSSLSFRFTPTGKPVLSIKDNLGANMFDLDSAGRITTANQILVPNGSATAPSYSFSGSTAGGFYWYLWCGSGNAFSSVGFRLSY